MASLNKVLVMGRLGFDPEIRYTSNQTAVATLRVATTEVWNRDGQRQENTEWHRVVVWGRQAENCSKYLSKGRPVFVEGRIQTRSWEDKDGQKRYSTEIVANNVQFLPSGGAGNQASSGSDYQSPSDNMSGGQFPQADMSSPSPAKDSSVSFDDIPF